MLPHLPSSSITRALQLVTLLACISVTGIAGYLFWTDNTVAGFLAIGISVFALVEVYVLGSLPRNEKNRTDSS